LDKKPKAPPKIADIAHTIYGLLEPLDSEDQRKIINASLTLLGEAPVGDTSSGGGGSGVAAEGGKPDQNIGGLHPRGASWMKQNGLSKAQIEEVIDIASEGMPVIVSPVPGKNAKAQTLNAYVLQGISRFLATGDTSFDDKSARKLCEDLGCLNAANHVRYMGGKGNLLTGSKDKGWKVTAPGLKHGADLVKQATGKGT
jgi:hypothetical protein